MSDAEQFTAAVPERSGPMDWRGGLERSGARWGRVGWQVAALKKRGYNAPNGIAPWFSGPIETPQKHFTRSELIRTICERLEVVLRSIEAGLQLPPRALGRSWDSRCRIGNLSSASVLFVLADLLQANEARPGEYGVMCALGPGFCLELVLLQW